MPRVANMVDKPLERVIRRTLLRAQGADALTDAQLLERFSVQHEEAAFELLVRRHGPMVHRACQRVLGAGPDSEDAFQAVFIALLRKSESIIHLESLGG